MIKAIFYDLGLVNRGWRKVTTCFRAEISCDTSKIIGRALYKNGVYELATSELVWKLLKQKPDALFVDIGANIGYYTLLASNALGGNGQIISFEPVPYLYEKLVGNINGGNINNYQYAVSSKDGVALLSIPQYADSNDGIATLEICEKSLESYEVKTITLDNFIDREIFILKMDIEGHEYSALSGAVKLLSHRKIKHIVFEDHNIKDSGISELLQSFGYTIFSIGWDFYGPLIKPLSEPKSSLVVEAPNYIATISMDEVLKVSSKGWSILQRDKF